MVVVMLVVDGRWEGIDDVKLRLVEGNHNLFPARYGVDDNEDYLGLARCEYRSLYVVVSSWDVVEVGRSNKRENRRDEERDILRSASVRTQAW
jgi:hypothetical protein